MTPCRYPLCCKLTVEATSHRTFTARARQSEKAKYMAHRSHRRMSPMMNILQLQQAVQQAFMSLPPFFRTLKIPAISGTI